MPSFGLFFDGTADRGKMAEMPHFDTGAFFPRLPPVFFHV
jgi:hypothetical protein